MTVPVLGIDLGTTNTVVAAVRGGHAASLTDEQGERLIPSIVSFRPDGKVLVGRDARRRRLLDPANTIYSVKRLIGRSWTSREVQKAKGRFPFELREGPGLAPMVTARGESYTLPEVSAFVLTKARKLAESALGGEAMRAVITVPANFDDLQRAATKVAGRIAGLDVLRILNEPTAAALAYGYGKGGSERIAVYDFGGGTFDLTLLDLAGNVFEVLATAGDSFLGGDDIDTAVAERMADAFLRQHRYDVRSDPSSFDRLRWAAEDLKKLLSTQDVARIAVEELHHGEGGRPLGLEFTMTRSEFDQIAAPVVARTFEVCSQALDLAHLHSSDFDQILLVGGSTRTPLVRREVERFFGRVPLSHLNPEEAVAIGASIQGAALAGAERRFSSIPPPPAPTGASTRPTQVTQPGLGIAAQPAERPTSPRAAPEPLLAGRDTKAGLGLKSPPRPPPPQDDDELPAALGGALVGARVAAASRPPQAPAKPEAIELDDEALLDFGAELSLPKQSPRTSADDAIPSVFELPVPEAPRNPSRRPRPPSVAPTVATPPRVEDASTRRAPGAPLLVDVTPLSLSVETVGGFCDRIIQRNSQVPCEERRVFVTTADNQTTVRVRVCQGESREFPRNTLLGEIILDGLHPAPRGQVRIEVAFALDTDGILDVTARDVATSKMASAKLELVALTGLGELEQLAARVASRATP